MDIYTLIGLIVIAVMLALGVGIILLVVRLVRRRGKKSPRTEKTQEKHAAVNLSFNTDMGLCKASGTGKKFQVDFEREAVSFIVEKGVITGYKKPNSTKITKY